MKTRLLVVALCIFNCITLFSQSQKDYAVVFYNVENFFDCVDDSLAADEEFTSEGNRYWTHWRFNKKRNNISKALLAAIGWDAPLVIGLCEVENRYVLDRLVKDTPLAKFPFRIIHKESPDHRGIDVACLYNTDLFYPIAYKYYPLISEEKIESTREILYLSGIVEEKDTLHFFMNHWPSRYSGVLETKSDRERAATLLKEKILELQGVNAKAKIVIMGDFNDQPSDESLSVNLNAASVDESINSESLYNLSYDWGRDFGGTLKYKSQWFVFDQIIVSGEILNSTQGVFSSVKKASICDDRFLLEEDESYGGKRPHRTYLGFKYKGGFSDHLPIKLVLTDR